MRAVTEVSRRWREMCAGHATVRDETCAAVAELLATAGWITFDAEQQYHSGLLNARALRLADRCGDRATAGLALLTLSMRAAHLGRLGQAHRLAGAGLEGGRLSARAAVPFHLRQARALALAGARSEALRSWDRARGLFGEGPSASDPTWAWWLDGYELVGHHGWAYAALHDWRRAVPLLQEAVSEPDAPAYRVVFATELLRCLLRATAWRDAESLMAQLAPVASKVGSTRALRSLHWAVASATAGPRLPAPVRDAAHHLGEALRSPGVQRGRLR